VYRIIYKTLAIAQVKSITGRPRLFQSAVVMGLRVRSESAVTMMLAVEPTIVPFPPKPAPKASAHHNGAMFMPSAQPLDDGNKCDRDRDVIHHCRKQRYDPDHADPEQHRRDVCHTLKQADD
jgi:hypothetical protein